MARRRCAAVTTFPRQVGHRGASLVRLQDADDLRFEIALALHLWTSLESTYKEIPHRAWLE